MCDLPCPSLPGKSSSAIQGHLDPWGGTCPAARSMPHFLSRPGPWIGLPCSAPSHGAPLLRVMASFKSESRAAPCGPPPFLVALSSPAHRARFRVGREPGRSSPGPEAQPHLPRVLGPILCAAPRPHGHRHTQTHTDTQTYTHTHTQHPGCLGISPAAQTSSWGPVLATSRLGQG